MPCALCGTLAYALRSAFIVFDVTRVSTFEAVQKWKHDIDSKVHLPNGEKVTRTSHSRVSLKSTFLLFMAVTCWTLICWIYVDRTEMLSRPIGLLPVLMCSAPCPCTQVPVVLLANKCDLAKEVCATQYRNKILHCLCDLATEMIYCPSALPLLLLELVYTSSVYMCADFVLHRFNFDRAS